MDTLNVERVSAPDKRISVREGKIFSYGIHTHTYCEMLLYEPFKGFVAVGNKKITVNRPCAVLISPLDFHEIRAEAPSEARFIKISLGAEAAGSSPNEVSFAALNLSDDSLLTKLFYEMLNYADDEALLLRLAECAVHIIRKIGEPICYSSGGRGYAISVEAKKIISTRFAEELGLEVIAKELSVSPQYLSSVFKHSFGITLSNYLTRIRLQYAEDLISRTNESITDICYASGYKSFSHFLRSFKREYGVSPGSYRRRNLR